VDPYGYDSYELQEINGWDNKGTDMCGYENAGCQWPGSRSRGSLDNLANSNHWNDINLRSNCYTSPQGQQVEKKCRKSPAYNLQISDNDITNFVSEVDLNVYSATCDPFTDNDCIHEGHMMYGDPPPNNLTDRYAELQTVFHRDNWKGLDSRRFSPNGYFTYDGGGGHDELPVRHNSHLFSKLGTMYGMSGDHLKTI
jgi:hypothetical protein